MDDIINVTVNNNFNPRSHAGSDKPRARMLAAAGHFNPRSHAGSDGRWILFSHINRISIHAPTQGATRNHCNAGILTGYFNPRSHAGSDFNLRRLSFGLVNFNPRSHAGSDIIVWLMRLVLRHFNPRSHAGSDLLVILLLRLINYFNPRSHAGSDPKRHSRPSR